MLCRRDVELLRNGWGARSSESVGRGTLRHKADVDVEARSLGLAGSSRIRTLPNGRICGFLDESSASARQIFAHPVPQRRGASEHSPRVAILLRIVIDRGTAPCM